MVGWYTVVHMDFHLILFGFIYIWNFNCFDATFKTQQFDDLNASEVSVYDAT